MQGVFVNGQRPRFKKDLVAALTDAPETVTFQQTAPMSPTEHDGAAIDAPFDVQLFVCGPDVYERRDWYATCTRGSGGRWTVA